MALTNNGLPNGGVTTYYKFLYDSALGGAGGIEPGRITTVMASCDADFNLMQSWFTGVTFPFTTPMEVDVNNDTSGTASWGPPVQLNDASDDAGYLRLLMIAEVTEMFMMSQAKGWFPGNEGSDGEGLSRFLAEQFLISSGLGLGEFPSWGWTANSWLASPTQPDWINNTDPTGDLNYVEIGCSILFIYYLFTQLNFSINQIIAAAAANLAGVYRNLTGDTGDPFPFFKQLVNTYPGPGGLSVGPNLDNPFPIGLVSIWTDKSTFGYDEVQDVIKAQSGWFRAAFWIVVEGFSESSFKALGVTVTLDGTLENTKGITVSQSTVYAIDYENTALPGAPQRIRIPYDIQFNAMTDGAFPATGGTPVELDLHASLQIGPNKVNASDAYAAFELVAGADPYFTNVDPNQGNVFYLSQDLRVFTATPALNSVPITGGPTFGTQTSAGAYNYIQNLLTYLNNNTGFTSGSSDPFTTMFPNQATAFTGDSSVTPTTAGNNNYNFAVARVRLRGSSGVAGDAQNVKVFFRLWVSQSADTDYQPSTTYLSTLDTAGLPATPQADAAPDTIPFFATGNYGSNSDYVSGGVNNQVLEIASGDTAWVYFGCFLNVYDPSNQVNGKQIQAWLSGTHHCLVAQIACDSAPIPTTAIVTPSPENSDKLAQRNLQVTTSDNPGDRDTHRVPQSFAVRPTLPHAATGIRLADLPDELMIDWGNVPVGSVASIYWPQVSAANVVALADQFYSFHALTASDANTIRCVVTDGVTYVPIPPSGSDGYAALLTIDLPQTVVTGQEFNVVVRRVVTTRPKRLPQPQNTLPTRFATTASTERSSRTQPPVFGKPPEPATAAAAVSPVQIAEQPPLWRFVTGAFQVKIPVQNAQSMLPAEENTLAIMKWRLQAIDASNRWHPVLQRYIQYVAARVKGLGGDPDNIPPSLAGAPPAVIEPCREVRRFVGRVLEVRFDCFGDFQGFLLGDCCEEREFASRDRGLGELVLRAFRYRLRLAVLVTESTQRIAKILLVE